MSSTTECWFRRVELQHNYFHLAIHCAVFRLNIDLRFNMPYCCRCHQFEIKLHSLESENTNKRNVSKPYELFRQSKLSYYFIRLKMNICPPTKSTTHTLCVCLHKLKRLIRRVQNHTRKHQFHTLIVVDLNFGEFNRLMVVSEQKICIYIFINTLW